MQNRRSFGFSFSFVSFASSSFCSYSSSCADNRPIFTVLLLCVGRFWVYTCIYLRQVNQLQWLNIHNCMGTIGISVYMPSFARRSFANAFVIFMPFIRFSRSDGRQFDCARTVRVSKLGLFLFSHIFSLVL